MGLKRIFFGENYINRKGLLEHLYFRIIIRGWFIDFPILIIVCYLIPWDKLHGIDLIEKITIFMESIIPNIEKNIAHSDFPEYAASFLSVIHLIGFICLLFPLFYSRPNNEIREHMLKGGHHPIKVIFLGLIGIFIFIFPPLYVGAVSYFGCFQCSYHNKFSLIAGAIVPWAILNLFFLYISIVIKNYFSKNIGVIK